MAPFFLTFGLEASLGIKALAKIKNKELKTLTRIWRAVIVCKAIIERLPGS